MSKRTIGWVQNPGDLKKLRKVVGVFLKDSEENKWARGSRLPLLLGLNLISLADYNLFQNLLNQPIIEIEYSKLKGKGVQGKSRSESKCTGIIQAIIDGQQNKSYEDNEGNAITIKKPFTDDWSADGYLRWAISCGLLKYDRTTDKCSISTLGQKLISTECESDEEREALSIALLSYPPVIRILSLLKRQDRQTKFELGNELGFKGELGFTSFTLPEFLCDYCEASSSSEKAKVRSNNEGDADKYARGIASWCQQMNWLSSSNEIKSGIYRNREYSATLQTYSLTRQGEKALIKARGNSSNPRISRIVLFEMLASNKAAGADSLRYERACIIKSLQSSAKSLDQLKKNLSSYGIELSESSIKDHIGGLSSIGLDILYSENKYHLRDNITGLVLPEKTLCQKEKVNEIKDRVRDKLKTLKHEFLILIDLAYSDATNSKKSSIARDFEKEIAKLFVEELGFNGKRLGESSKPDIIISYEEKGSIIDAKSYQLGFNIDRHNRDEMARYVNENQQRINGIPSNEWWKEFDDKVIIFTFLFVTSFLNGKFKEQLEYISNTHSNIQGGAINVENLLYLAENILSGRKSRESFFKDFQNNELVYSVQ